MGEPASGEHVAVTHSGRLRRTAAVVVEVYPIQSGVVGLQVISAGPVPLTSGEAATVLRDGLDLVEDGKLRHQEAAGDPSAAELLGAINHSLSTGVMSAGILALMELCDRLGVDPDLLHYRPANPANPGEGR